MEVTAVANPELENQVIYTGRFRFALRCCPLGWDLRNIVSAPQGSKVPQTHQYSNVFIPSFIICAGNFYRPLFRNKELL
jgi:hypothetical protein